ncbi:hypothetical protein N7523_006435 [Penicillium sp. IBT 18751x]|nr:hypothetical protein N7523_006435 [Penicillium sp. IBT 18751x]
MGQRSRMLDTEGQTPMFLYAIIKQLDVKSVDWNRLASDLEISNGHAARMRYSRFMSQLDPSSVRKYARKKNLEKSKENESKGDVPASTPGPHANANAISDFSSIAGAKDEALQFSLFIKRIHYLRAREAEECCGSSFHRYAQLSTSFPALDVY